ncbi:recombinase family protein [Streptomyces lydicamycinicus]
MPRIARPEATEYDGCGKCLVGVRRLSRRSESSNSPEKQSGLILKATEEVGGHIIAWADDWEVSGATDPRTRPEFGPWLRGEMGPYDGIVGAAVDRVGRNVRDVLNTAYTIHEAGQLLVTADHAGVWNLDDPNEESELLVKALGAQLEHRATKKRIQDEHVRARKAGQPKKQPSYGYQYIRYIPTGKVVEVGLHPEAARQIRNVARRILADTSGEITICTEVARLTREGVFSPRDLLAVMYGREPKGIPWQYQTLRNILWSEASLGYLMHKGKPVLGDNGQPIQIAPPLWDRATRLALIEKTKPKRRKPRGKRAPRGTKLCAGRAICGNCAVRLSVTGSNGYGCQGRVRGFPESRHCKPAPMIKFHLLDAEVEAWFLAEYGPGLVMRKEFDPGTNYAAQIADLEADRKRLRDDRRAGLYDAEDDVEWYRAEYSRMGNEISELKKLPDRPAGMKLIPTGKTVADAWREARDDAERRELLIEFNVQVSLFPAAAPQRIKFTGTNVYDLVR